MRAMAVRLLVGIMLSLWVLGGSTAGASASCDVFGLNCELCVATGCSWQNPGGCRPACEFPGPACYSGIAETCPKPECNRHDGDCAACLRSGCGYRTSSGGCQESCSSPKGCVAPGSDASMCPGYGEICKQAETCEDCVAAKCTFQGGECKPECDRSSGFVAGGCVNEDSVEQGLTCSSPTESEDAVPHGYCAHDCIGEPVETGWCQASAGRCVTAVGRRGARQMGSAASTLVGPCPHGWTGGAWPGRYSASGVAASGAGSDTGHPPAMPSQSPQE
eukprot:CAMPEP_0117670798 /NCGR_PEP_ID=MMETSP0804-20121206/12970_1 /TAXON_ID=1074897 /ORGANISM="Tetraselmis astigmatica, Strain CCMP880" /LENGTH=275 /DNA_ID=CAMNT_0005479171 /DNA_START=311 /DNA_END=1139 /DNA_ORIENTATION=+